MNNGTVGIVVCLKGLSIYGMYIERIAQFKGYLLRGAYLELNTKFLIFPKTCRYAAPSHSQNFLGYDEGILASSRGQATGTLIFIL